MAPEPGTLVSEGDTVTLLVSTGPPDEDEESGFTPPGHAKKDKKDKGKDH
jgi:beta-lactam-binding protein with PASTA domain